MLNHYVKSFSNRIKIAERTKMKSFLITFFMVEYFSFTFLGRNVVFINLNIMRCRLIANIGAIDCSEMEKDPY